VYHGGCVLCGAGRDSAPLGREDDYVLMIGPSPAADSPTSHAGKLQIALTHHGTTISREFPFGGHPEILRPRAAKQALNLLRLHLLGKVH
jgi:nicotinamide-nucleotide amidase